MRIQKILIHELIKNRNERGAETFISNALLPINDTTTLLVQKLVNSYKDDKITYAIFDDSEGKYFPEQFEVYRQSPKQTEDFIQFTARVTNSLRDQIRYTTFATGGFLVYIEYEVDNNTFYGVFLVRDNTGVTFKRNDAGTRVIVDQVQYMDIEKLAMACRINVNKYVSRNGKYLTFVRRKQQIVSEYFLRWICVSQPESSKEYTEALYSIVREMPLPIDEDTSEEIDLNTFRRRIVNFISGQNYNVDLHVLGEHFYDDRNAFTDYVTENEIEIDREFRANKTALRKFHQIHLKAGDIEIKFSRGDLNDSVRLGRGNQVIIKNETLRNALSDELENE